MMKKENFILDLAQGLTRKEMAQKYGVSESTIARRKRQWGLVQKPRRLKTHEEYIQSLPSTVQCNDIYINDRTKISHECTQCGNIWDVTPNNIRNGQGCPVCAIASNSYKYLYIIKFSDGLMKVGVTNKPKMSRQFGEKYEVLSFLESADGTAGKLEQELLRFIRPWLLNTGRLKNGNTETYYAPT